VNEVELTLSDSTHDLRICAPIEWRDSAKQDKSYYAERPQIALFAIIFAQHFWSNIIWGADLFFLTLLRVKFLSGSKVDDFDLVKFFACL
jgi:hypothetical protein